MKAELSKDTIKIEDKENGTPRENEALSPSLSNNGEEIA
jgi:hypothetical protein